MLLDNVAHNAHKKKTSRGGVTLSTLWNGKSWTSNCAKVNPGVESPNSSYANSSNISWGYELRMTATINLRMGTDLSNSIQLPLKK